MSARLFFHNMYSCKIKKLTQLVRSYVIKIFVYLRLIQE